MYKFANYNDFELLYLIKEGSEQALNTLFQKYSVYINMIAKKYYPYGDKRNDLVQEGLMILNSCIKNYDNSFRIKFYSYFSIALHRRYSYLMKNTSYYILKETSKPYNENIPDESSKPRRLYVSDIEFKDELDNNIYKEVILLGISVKEFSNKYLIELNKVYYRRRLIIEELKKLLTI